MRGTSEEKLEMIPPDEESAVSQRMIRELKKLLNSLILDGHTSD